MRLNSDYSKNMFYKELKDAGNVKFVLGFMTSTIEKMQVGLNFKEWTDTNYNKQDLEGVRTKVLSNYWLNKKFISYLIFLDNLISGSEHVRKKLFAITVGDKHKIFTVTKEDKTLTMNLDEEDKKKCEEIYGKLYY